jgi:hypothetical protein
MSDEDFYQKCLMMPSIFIPEFQTTIKNNTHEYLGYFLKEDNRGYIVVNINSLYSNFLPFREIKAFPLIYRNNQVFIGIDPFIESFIHSLIIQTNPEGSIEALQDYYRE